MGRPRVQERELDHARESEQGEIIPFEETAAFVEREMAELAEANARRRRESPFNPPPAVEQMLHVVDANFEPTLVRLRSLREAIDTEIRLVTERQLMWRDCVTTLGEQTSAVTRFAESAAEAFSGIAKEFLASPTPQIARPIEEE